VGSDRSRSYLRRQCDQADGSGLHTAACRSKSNPARSQPERTVFASVTKFALLSSSLVPIFVVLAIRLSGKQCHTAAALVVISIALTALLIVVLQARRRTTAQPFAVDTIRDESQQIPAYLLTYIFPFLFLSVGGWRDVAAFLVFALLVLILLFRTDLALVNPLLLATGFHLYSLTTTSGKCLILVAKDKPSPGQSILAVRLSDTTYKLESIQS
jgi:hypothetical protein